MSAPPRYGPISQMRKTVTRQGPTGGEAERALSPAAWVQCACSHDQQSEMYLLTINFFFFNLLFIYLFIFGCVGSSFLCEGFL